MTSKAMSQAETVSAYDCPWLARIDAPRAQTVDVSGCTALTQIDAPKAKIVRCPYHFGGIDARGYVFDAIKSKGEWRIIAGCRNLSIDEARHHWGPGGPSDRPDCLALVEQLAAAIAQDDMSPAELPS